MAPASKLRFVGPRWVPAYAIANLAIWPVLVPLLIAVGQGEGLWSILAVASVLKVLLLAAVLLDLARMYEALGERRIGALRTLLTWCLCLGGYVLVLAALRTPLAELLSSAQVKTSTHEFTGYEFPPSVAERDRAAHESWIGRWDSGFLLAVELGFVLVLAGLHVTMGRVAGHFGRGWAFFGGFLTAVLAAGVTGGFGLLRVTYDDYFEGILSCFLAVELCNPILSMPPWSPICAVAFLLLSLANRWLLGSAGAARLPS